MKTIKLANVVVQIHVRDEYSGQRVLYCPWVNCKHYSNGECTYKDSYGCNCCRFVLMNGQTYCQGYERDEVMIAIKGMDMPANCGECPLTYPVGFYRNLPFSVDKSKGCCILVCEIEDPNIRLIDCPLIEIKEHEEK